MSVNILIPMTGQNRFEGEEYVYPKPLIDIGGKTILERSLEAYKGLEGDRKIIPIISLEDVKSFNLDYVFRQLLPHDELRLIELENTTQGALCTALLAIDEIDKDKELLIVNSDHIIDIAMPKILNFFRKKSAEFGVVCFEAIHPKWSYVRLNEEGVIEEAAEKRPISKNAIAGLYYYKRGRDFIEAAKRAIEKRSTHAGKFFISSSLNELVLMNKKGLAYKIPNENYTNFYDINAIKNYSRKIEEEYKGNDILKLTEKYISFFNARELENILKLMDQSFVLEDPVVKKITGRENIRIFLSQLFEEKEVFRFSALDIATINSKSFIEFELVLNEKVIRGVDVITWSKGKMVSLIAHMGEI